MKKIMVVAAAVLFSTFAFANRMEKPVTGSSIAVMNAGSNLVRVFYKSEKLNDVKISIRNEKDLVVFSESFKQIDGFMRPYNFENLSEGKYTILVEDENGKQVEKINYGPKRIEKLVNIAKVQSEEGKYLITGTSRGADKISIRISDSDGKTIYEESRQVDGRFAQVYNLKGLKGTFSIEVSDTFGILKAFGN